MTHFISLTLEQPLPNSCGVCPFLSYSETGDEMSCPVAGDIKEWAFGEDQEKQYIGWTCRHHDCKLQTWEAQRVLRFVVEDEHADNH